MHTWVQLSEPPLFLCEFGNFEKLVPRSTSSSEILYFLQGLLHLFDLTDLDSSQSLRCLDKDLDKEIEAWEVKCLSQSHSANVVTGPRFPHPWASIVLTPSCCVLVSYKSSKSWMITPITKPHNLIGYSAELNTTAFILDSSDTSPLQAVLCAVTDHCSLPSMWHDLDPICGHKPVEGNLVSLQSTISLSLQASWSCHFVIIAAKTPPLILWRSPPLAPYGPHGFLKGLMRWCFVILQDFRFPWINITNTMHCISAFCIKKDY